MKIELINSYRVEFTADEMKTLRAMLQDYANITPDDERLNDAESIFQSFGIKFYDRHVVESEAEPDDDYKEQVENDDETLVEKALRISSGKRKIKITNRE